MTSFADLVHARCVPSGRAERVAVAGLFARSRHVMAAPEAS
jgi:hypothetical protein